jgi:hypothetical protein
MVPAHHIVEIALVGCPYPDPIYTRFFTPERGTLPADVDEIGRRYIGALVRNLELLRFAHHWSFTPRACRPYRAQTKGKVERPVRYLRDDVVYGRTFLNDADLDQQRRLWLDDVANVRVHGTTRERPADRFDRDERLLLQPLAPRPYTSLVLTTAPCHATPYASLRPVVAVEKRPLAVYARLTGGLA